MGIVNMFCRNPELKSRLENSRPRLYRLAYSWCHDTYLADDLVQETLSKGIKNVGKLRNPETLESWLFTILTNTWRSHLRAKKEVVEYNEESFHTDATPEQLNSRYETVNSVQQAVGQLAIGQRQVLTLVDLEGFSYAEVAQILDIPIGTVMSRLCRARQALKENLLENASDNEQYLKLVKVK
jgi:RNA polymerase sigma-70 factor (ECF subfamily)